MVGLRASNGNRCLYTLPTMYLKYRMLDGFFALHIGDFSVYPIFRGIVSSAPVSFCFVFVSFSFRPFDPTARGTRRKYERFGYNPTSFRKGERTGIVTYRYG